MENEAYNKGRKKRKKKGNEESESYSPEQAKKWENQFWEEQQNLVNFMKQEGFFDNAKVNERMYAGDHWFHLSKNNKLARIIINFFKRIVNFLVAAVMDTEVKLNFSPQPYKDTEDNKENVEKYNKYAEIMSKYSDIAYEELELNDLNEQMLKDAFLTGIGIQHFYWDDEYECGNDVKVKGRWRAEIIKGVNFFPLNPALLDLDKQKRIHITYRMDCDAVKSEAKANGVPDYKIAEITPDQDTTDQAYDKAQREPTGSRNLNVLLTYQRDDDDGYWYMTKRTKSVVFSPLKSTKKKHVPLLYVNAETRESYIYGNSPMTEVVPNQIYVNTIYSMAMTSIQKTAYPKAIYDRTRVGKPSNAVGVGIGVEGPVGNDVIRYAQTGTVSTDVYNIVDNVIAKTKENANANDALLGNVKPENTSAILVAQEQAGMPLKTIQRRFYKSQERFGILLEEAVQVHMGITRPINLKTEKGEIETMDFNSKDFKGIKLNTKIDVGPATSYNEVVTVNTLNDWLAQGHVTFVEVLERYPKQIVPRIQALIDSRKKVENDETLAGLDDEQKAMIGQLPPEEQKLMLDDIKQGGIG